MLITLFYFKTIDMARGVNNCQITKQTIFNKISQIAIFSAYTNIPVETISWCIEKGKLINSPFREDLHPSFGFKYDNRGKLKGRDFAGFWWGDCIDCAATVISNIVKRNLDVSNKYDFQLVLQHIVYMFSDVFYGTKKDTNLNGEVKISLNTIRQTKNIIEVVTRPWNKDDKEYWNNIGVSLNYLNTHFIYAVDQYYINRNVNPMPKYFYDKNPKDLCYAYYLGNDTKGISNIKLYFPRRGRDEKEVRFITNVNCLEGINLIEPIEYDYIIITKSTKDRLSLGSYLDTIPYGDVINNIAVVNIPHETYRLTEEEYNWLCNRTKRKVNSIISFMDNDRTGYKEAIWLRDNFGIIPILIPKEYDAKDFSELISKYSINTINQLLEEVLYYIRENYESDKPEWNPKEDNTIYF